MHAIIKILALCATVLCITPQVAEEERPIELYYRFGNVVDLEWEYDCITLDDGLGNLWEYYGLVDYVYYGDLMVMIMSDNRTPDWIYDDVVVNAYPCSIDEASDIVQTYKATYGRK